MKKTKKTPQPTKTNFQYEELAACFNLGSSCLAQGKLEDAEKNYLQAIALKPDFAEAYNNLGVVLQQLGKLDEAIEKHQHALRLKPNYAQAFQNLGLAFKAQKKLDAALENYRRAILLDPNNVDLHQNLGIIFSEELGKHNEAINSFRRALKINPNLAKTYLLLAESLKAQGKFSAAIESYQQALSINPDYDIAFYALVWTLIQCCEWTDYESNRKKIVAELNKEESKQRPFALLAISDSAASQFQCARIYAASQFPRLQTPLWSGQCYQHDKIRIAYLSADFREHPLSYLMAGLFEQHNRERFEIIAISLRAEEKSSTGQRVKAAVDRFIDVSDISDFEVALLLKDLEIDIAVDLMGFTQHRRTAIFSYRPAPVQINYLGFPATMGTAYMDYIFADYYSIPPEYQAYYTEKVVYLPDCFQANDDKRVITTPTPTRSEAGLPESGFVFCIFNSSHKITPSFFDVWMRLLKTIPNSVLWLVSDDQFVQNNLCQEAIKRGVSPERLIFAGRLKYADHLARFQLADLFLDTLPFNAGTTASDALWAGVPVITCSGEAFASRMAGSLLTAIGLPELITHNLEEYETLAFKLATTPELLSEIRDKLTRNRTTYPLFNTDRFRQHIEAAYTMMWERYQREELPTSFAVPAIG